MPTITPTRLARPAELPTPTISVETASITHLDDLNLTKNPAEAHRTLVVTAVTLSTELASITDGAFTGQRLTLIVENITNALVVPIALGNVTHIANISVDDSAPATLVWDGIAWRLAA